jgi:hypothetical protein
MMPKINWGIRDFVRMSKKDNQNNTLLDSSKTENELNSKTDLIANLQKENNFKKYDTAYYKENVCGFIFKSDKEFASKFPLVWNS